MAGPIDVAYVEILPDLKRFDKDATKGIKAALDDAAKEADKATAKIGDSLADSVKQGAAQAKVYINKLGQEIREVDGTITIKTVIDGKETIETLRRDLQGRLRKSNGQFITSGELAGLGIGAGIANGAKSALVSGLADVGKTLGGVLSAAGPYVQTAAIGLGAAVATSLAGAIGPAIVALGASLPAAAGIAGSAIATLALGFHGLGDAIENMDDVEKFDEALKKLTPSARNFALELRGLQPIFSSIKAAAQEGIFKGLEGQLTRVVTTLQGPLKAGLTDVGNSIQGVIVQLGNFATSRVGVDAINTLFGTTAQIIDDITVALGPLLEGIGKLTIAGTPFIEKLSGKFSEFLANIGTGLSKAADSGDLERLFDKAYETLSKVWDISKDVYEILRNIFSAGEDSGQGILDSLKEMTADLKRLSENETFVEALRTSFELLLGAVRQVEVGFKVLAVVFEELDRVDKDIAGLVESFYKFGESVGKAFDSALQSVGEFFKGVGDWFSKIPGEIENFVSAIPQFVETAFRNATAVALNALGVGIGFILSSIMELPTQIGNALSSLGTTVTTFFTNLWTTVSDWTVIKWGELLTWFSELPAKIIEALSALPGLLETFFVGLWTSVSEWTVTKWTEIVDWIAGVPGRLADLATDFYNSGINMIKGLFEGIANGASDGADSVGNAVYGAFKSAVNWAIGQINEGISSVDGVFPGAIPRIPYLAKGGIALGPSMIGEAGEELAIPLTGQRSKKALQQVANAANGGSSGVVFEPGSIVLNFEGAVPTKDQAFQVGEAAGMGIASILQKRNVRTRIRTA